ncbi:YqaJ viral recombinase family protein [Corynebacterium glyciniphilum]|uniref:YqaJ viral recombinase family protein n=1 Tax=Corynebacterium glyciniphilum TaxID=1404244 RepID=UPI003FD57FAC
MGFVELPYTGEEEWLRQRRSVVTATDVAKIKTGSDKAFASLWREKRTPSTFRGNRFTQHGKDREPVIAAMLTEDYPWLRPNRSLLISDDDARFGATPDMVSDDGLVLGEIKTRKVSDDKDEWLSWADVCADQTGKKYACQVAWQLFVTGAERCVFAVEHWSDEDGWADLRPLRVFDVERDEVLIAELRDVAERFLEFTPPELVQGDQSDFEAMAVARALAEEESAIALLRAELREHEKARAALQADLLDAVGTQSRSVDYGGFVVEVSPGRRSRSFDRKALAADYPELESKYTIEKDGQPTVKVRGAD